MTDLDPVLNQFNPCSNDIISNQSGAAANASSETNKDLLEMEEFKKKDDRSPKEKYEGNEHHDEKEANNCPSKNNCPSNNNGFQLHDDKPETAFIQEKDLKPGLQNSSSMAEPCIRKEQMPNLDIEDQSNHRTTLECSKDFSGKYKCIQPCLAIVSPYKNPTLSQGLTPTNFSSESTSRPENGVLFMDVSARYKKGKVKSPQRNWVGMISSTVNRKTNASEMDKGKEQIIYGADDSISSSNRRANGNAKFECISSRGINSTVKRARICETESEKLIGGKRLKRLSNGNCSFMNWLTTITNGLTRPSHEAPMEVFQHPSQHMKRVMSPPISDEDKEYIGVSRGTRGFRSIFQAMYHPVSNVSNSNIKYVDHRKEMDAFKETKAEKVGDGACCVLRERLSFGQHRSFPALSFSFLNVVKGNISTGPANISSYGIASRDNEFLPTSKRFNRDVFQVENSPSAAMDSCAKLITQNGHSFQNSLWITRFSPVVSSPQPKSIQCSNYLDLSAQKLQNDSVHKLPFLEAQTNICFGLDHWAASCLNASSKGNQVSCKNNGFNDVNFKRTAEKKDVNQPITNYDEAVMLLPESKKDCHQVLSGSSVFQEENKTAETNFVVHAKVSGPKNESAAYGTIDICMNRLEDTTNKENMKMTTSCSRQNELRRYELKPFYCHLPATEMNEQKGIFDAVRKLRLSRMDISRWIKSSTPQYNLGGFFLRLRIGKLEKGLGATGNHVACINGARHESSISVCIESSNYLVTSGFISNQDFDEDELKAWWFRKVKDGGKMPSREELNEKFQLRIKFGF